MRLLLDTHIILWAVAESTRIEPACGGRGGTAAQRAASPPITTD
jgi:PIN domain nuclease of toxin-antitoxin system